MAQLAEFIYDEQIESAIIDVISGAEEYLVLVSPYNAYSPDLSDAVKRASEKEVRIIAVCRKDMRKKESTHLNWLKSDLGARVHLVERLHAKIYLNESAGIVTSMNLIEGSAKRSKEIGFRINDEAMLRSIKEYVLERLVRGFCIRCREEIPYNSKNPLCPKCLYDPDRLSDPNLERDYCHHCGEERANISFTKPLCRSCYRETASDKRRAAK